jgi:hypothetical protein
MRIPNPLLVFLINLLIFYGILRILTFTASRLLYVPPGVTLKNSTTCSHYVYVFCTDLRRNSDFCPTQHYQIGFV